MHACTTGGQWLQVQEQFIGEVIDEFLREPGTDAAEEKRSCRRGREQHVTIVLPPELLQKLPKLNSKMQQMHTAAVAMDPSLSLYGSAPTECVISEGSVLGLAGLVVTLQRIEGLGEERNFGEEMEVLQWFGNTQLHASFAAQTLMVRCHGDISGVLFGFWPKVCLARNQLWWGDFASFVPPSCELRVLFSPIS